MNRPGRTSKVSVTRFEGSRDSEHQDVVATEEPLEIRLCGAGVTQTLAVTMRTPGADMELAAGFLFAEGVVQSKDAIEAIRYCTDPDVDQEQLFNIVTIDLRGPLPKLETMERHFLTSSACGVCGSATLEALAARGISAIESDATFDRSILGTLPEAMRTAQTTFDSTGGLHAAGIYRSDGSALVVREDVGRHNAVDKAIGWALLDGALPLTQHVLMVSGRSSYEIVQKAAVAGIPILCSISAPSSLAVQVARTFGITLVGFLRDDRMNVYSHPRRITTRTR